MQRAEGLVKRRDDQPLTVAPQHAELLELIERVGDVKINVDAKGRSQPSLDAAVELRRDRR